MKLKKKVIVISLLFISWISAFSQNVGIKTNLLYDALLSPTVGVEVGLAPKWSLDVSGTVNAWNIKEHRWRQWMVQPEARYWFCQRYTGHFLGVHAIGGQYNFGNLNIPFKFLGTDFRELKDRRLQGWMVGAGVAYGYSWILDRHWNIEAEIGLGWIYTRYDKYKCPGCGKEVDHDLKHNYVGPTKLAVNLIYIF